MKLGAHAWWVFVQFMYRDFTVRKKKLADNIINYMVLYPVLFGLETAYLQANIYFGTSDIQRNTLFFAGNIIFIMMIFSYNQNLELLFDFENKRFIDYQITILHPFLVMLERIVGTALYTFLIMVPFYPITGFLFSAHVDFSHMRWLPLFTILFLGALCLSTYFILAASLLESSNLRSLWARVNRPLIFLGGLWVPWYIVHQYSPLFSYCLLLNPCLYISEGVKGAITGDARFIPFWICGGMLIVCNTILMIWCWHAFKKRTDCL